MNDFLQNLIPTLENLKLIGYIVVFFAALIESFIILGYFIPGATIILIFGMLAGRGYYHLGDVIFFSAIGNIFGNIISYYLGKKVGVKVFEKGFLFIKPSYFIKAELFFEKHGGKSILFGRTIPGLKENIPFISGVLNINIVKFILYNIIGASIWSIILVGIGYFFSSSLTIAEMGISRFGFILLIILIIFISIFFIKFIFTKYGNTFLNLLSDLLLYLKQNFLSISIVKKIINNNPGIVKFLNNRVSKNIFTGLPLTILILLFIYIMVEYLLFTDAVLDGKMITQIDVRLSEFFYYFRDQRLINFFLLISYLGSKIIVLLVIFISTTILYFRGKKQEIIGLLVSVFTSTFVVVISKLLIERNRPELAVYIENNYSFPSFHATISVSLYGYIIYFLAKKYKSWKTKVNIYFLGIIIAFFIGFSRLYLNVHYLSDVISGWFLGTLGLLFGITIIGYIDHKIIINKLKLSKIYSIYLTYITIIFGIIFSIFYYKIYYNNIVFTDYKNENYKTVDNINQFFTNNHLKFTETITGRETETINFIFLSKSDDNLLRLFNDSGWKEADKIGRYSLKNIGKALLNNELYNNAPITPLYWNKEIQNFGFEKFTDKNTIKIRHHIRIWKSNYKIGENYIYVGCGVYDDGLKWGITHKIDPDIDKEREYIFSTFTNNYDIKNYDLLQLEKAFEGKNFSGDKFFTDGKAYYIEIQ
ncbi:MAG: LssY C-terminal domain-containing protein [Candidatus Gracilibacteria bacterium]|nr:LssY C-terminal domain-containing protein [Candidatus Gracilibacteria bacterium]